MEHRERRRIIGLQPRRVMRLSNGFAMCKSLCKFGSKDGLRKPREVTMKMKRWVLSVLLVCMSVVASAAETSGTVYECYRIFDSSSVGVWTPYQAKGLTDVTTLAYDYVIKTDGAIWTYGTLLATKDGVIWQEGEQLSSIPDTAIVAESYSVEVREDGTVWTQGTNYAGQLGDGTTAIQVPDLTDVATVIAGNDYVVAIKKDGTVWTWGENRILNDGVVRTEDACLNPIQVPDITDVIDVISVGLAGSPLRFTFALKADGTVWELGLTPTQVTGLIGVSAISAIRSGFAVIVDADVSSPLADEPEEDDTTVDLDELNDGLTVNTDLLDALGANNVEEVVEQADFNGFTNVFTIPCVDVGAKSYYVQLHRDASGDFTVMPDTLKEVTTTALGSFNGFSGILSVESVSVGAEVYSVELDLIDADAMTFRLKTAQVVQE